MQTDIREEIGWNWRSISTTVGIHQLETLGQHISDTVWRPQDLKPDGVTLTLGPRAQEHEQLWKEPESPKVIDPWVETQEKGSPASEKRDFELCCLCFRPKLLSITRSPDAEARTCPFYPLTHVLSQDEFDIISFRIFGHCVPRWTSLQETLGNLASLVIVLFLRKDHDDPVPSVFLFPNFKHGADSVSPCHGVQHTGAHW